VKVLLVYPVHKSLFGGVSTSREGAQNKTHTPHIFSAIVQFSYCSFSLSLEGTPDHANATTIVQILIHFFLLRHAR
jgi:hypothetical protein